MPDPHSLGDPAEYDGLGSFVRLLQMGAEAGEVLRLMPTETRQAVAAADPGRLPLPPLMLLTADEILEMPFCEPEWVVPDVLPVGLAILAGRPKVGKSWLALQIAQAVASGGMVLGRAVKQGPVLYLALEDRPMRLKERMKQQGWIQGLDCEFMVLGEFGQQIGDLKGEGGEKLARQIELRAYRLVVIDTLSRAVAGDQMDPDKMTRALAPLQEIAGIHNCAVMLIDHHNKGFGSTPDAVLDILGSTAKGAVADTIWGLYRDSGKGSSTLATLGRDVDEQTLALEWDLRTACWHCQGDANELEMTERRQQILRVLAEMQAATVQEIAEATGQDRSNTYRRLQDLRAARKVIRGSGRPAVYNLA